MTMSVRKILGDYQEVLDTLEETIILFLKKEANIEKEIEKLTAVIAQNQEVKNVFDFCTDRLGELVNDLKTVKAEREQVERESEAAKKIQPLLIEIARKNCDHKQKFKGSRGYQDFYECEYCGKIYEYQVPELKRSH